MFPLIKLAKKLKASATVRKGKLAEMFPLIKLAKKLKVVFFVWDCSPANRRFH